MKEACSLPTIPAFVFCALTMPGAALAVAVNEQTVMVPMRDGTQLATDTYVPQIPSHVPAILVRTCYGKSGTAAFARRLATSGMYAAVVQDVRGLNASEGQFSLFMTDAQDGYDTIAWINTQTWSNSKVGTYGSSCLGVVQYLLAGQDPPGLTCQWVQVATPDLYVTGIFSGGVFRKSLIEGWLDGIGHPEAIGLIHDNPRLTAFWDPVRVNYSGVNTSAVHVGGWYDIFLQGTLDAFAGYSLRGGTQKLIIGPWVHGGTDSATQGQLAYPDNSTIANSPSAGAAVEWLGLCLRGRDTPAAQWPVVEYYLMGEACQDTGGSCVSTGPGNIWKVADTWPPPGTQDVPFFLSPDGNLVSERPTISPAYSELTSDPQDPVATVCGANLTIAKGPCDQSATVESRTTSSHDVLVFSTPILSDPLEVTGRVSVRLFFSTDVPDLDLMVRLTDVYPDGRSMLVADAAIQARHRNTLAADELLTAGDEYSATVDLWSTAIVFGPGHRVRVSISGSNYPRFELNPQTGEAFPYSQTAFSSQLAHVQILHDCSHPSALILPVMNAPTPADDGTVMDMCAAAPPVAEDDEPVRDTAKTGCDCNGAPNSSLLSIFWIFGLAFRQIPKRRHANSKASAMPGTQPRTREETR
jgi:uncharacterized protein